MTKKQIKRGDNLPGATITCLNGRRPAPIDTASSARLLGRVGSTLIIDRPIPTPLPANGQIVIDSWEDGDTDTVGTLELEVEVTWDDGLIQTFPGGSYLELEIVADLG